MEEQPVATEVPATSAGRRIAPAIRGVLMAAVVAISLYLCGRLAFATMYSIFQAYDDEGATLIVLDQMAQGHPLYDQVTSMYGPMGFLPKLALVKLLHLPVDHDTGRALSLAYWLLMCGALGIVAWRLGGSVTWFALGSLSVCVMLEMMTNEPGHPQDACGLLLSLAVLSCVITSRGGLTWVIVILAILAGLLCMTKINLGAFYIAALGAAMLCQMPPGRFRGRLLGGLAVLLFACPFALMYRDFDKGSAYPYAWEVGLSLVSCLVVATAVSSKFQLKPAHLLHGPIAFVAAIFVVVIACMAMGTSLGGLVQGVIFLPLLVSSAFSLPAPMTFQSVAIAATGLGLAAALAGWLGYPGRASKLVLLTIGLLRIAVASAMIYYVMRVDREDALSNIPGFIWLLLLPVQRRPGSPDFFFARLFLSFLAVFESMWAFPVSGTQRAFAVMLPTIVGVVTLADGIGNLSSVLPNVTFAGVFRQTSAVAIMVVSLYGGWVFAEGSMDKYRSQVPLDLPGSHWIRVASGTAHTYQTLTADLKLNADAFYTAPGLNSFYFWTQQPPPTPANVTGWMYILTDAQQQKIVDELASHPRVCFLYLQDWMHFWMQGTPPREGPLLRYFHTEFRLGYKFGAAEIWVGKDRTYVDVMGDDGKVHRQALPATEP